MKTFNEIVSRSFNIKEADIKNNLSSKDIANWDSMNYLLFISELEKEFNISFTMDEVLSAESLGSIRAMLKSKGKQI